MKKSLVFGYVVLAIELGRMSEIMTRELKRWRITCLINMARTLSLCSWTRVVRTVSCSAEKTVSFTELSAQLGSVNCSGPSSLPQALLRKVTLMFA